MKTDFDKFLEESLEVKDYLKSFDKKRLDLHEVNLMRIVWGIAYEKGHFDGNEQGYWNGREDA